MLLKQVPKEIVRALCRLLEWKEDEVEVLHRKIAALLRQKGAKLTQLYLVVGSDGYIATVAHRMSRLKYD